MILLQLEMNVMEFLCRNTYFFTSPPSQWNNSLVFCLEEVEVILENHLERGDDSDSFANGAGSCEGRYFPTYPPKLSRACGGDANSCTTNCTLMIR